MNAEILSIGSELLLGQVVDTNAASIARQLAGLGVDLFHKVTVGDNLARVVEAVRTALGRSTVVITTGGVGPTADDVTREAVAEATGRDLVFVPELMDQIEAFFRSRGFSASPSNRKQAFVPRNAIPLPNPVGTAPCFIVEVGDRAVVSLPGVPREMEHLLSTGVIPYLRERYRLTGVITTRVLRICGMGESRVGEILGDYMAQGVNPTVGTMAHLGQVDVRIAAKAAHPDAARALIATVEAEIRRRLGDLVFGADGDTLEEVVGTGLAARGWRLGLLEAGTGGLIAERLTGVPGLAERVDAVVTADPSRVGHPALAAGSSSAEAARAIRRWAGAEVGAAVVMASSRGDAGVYPTHLGAVADGVELTREHRFGGDLRQARVRACVMALDLLRRTLMAVPP